MEGVGGRVAGSVGGHGHGDGGTGTEALRDRRDDSEKKLS